MRKILYILLLFSFKIFGQETGIPIYQLQYAPDSNYVIGALEDGEPVWIRRNIVHLDSIYSELFLIDINGDYAYSVKLRDGSGEAIIPVNFPNYFLQGTKETTSLPNQNGNTRFGISSLRGGIFISTVDGHQFIFNIDTSSNNEVGILSLNRDTLFYKPCLGCDQQFWEIPKIKAGQTTTVQTAIINDTLYAEVNPNSIDSTHIKNSGISINNLNFTPLLEVTGTAPIFVSGSGNQRNITYNGLRGTGVPTRVAFWGATDTLTSDGSFYWDNMYKRLGIGTEYPQEALHVTGKLRVDNRSGSAIYGAGWDANNNLVQYSLDTSTSLPNTYITGSTFIGINGSGTMEDPYQIINNGDTSNLNELQDLFAYSNGFIVDNPTATLNDTVIFNYVAPLVIDTPPSTCNCSISDIPTLVSQLAGKSSTSHTHIITDVTGLQTALDGKAAVSHTHIVADVTGLQTALDGKSSIGHTHIINDVTGLQTALDSKEPSFAKGSIIEGTGVTISGTLTNRLVGSGNITINSSGGAATQLFEDIKTSSTTLGSSMQVIVSLSLTTGTYLITGNLNGIVLSGTINAEIFNSTDNSVLARGSVNNTIANITLQRVITISGTKTIQVRASGNGNQLYSSSQGTQVITALKI